MRDKTTSEESIGFSTQCKKSRSLDKFNVREKTRPVESSRKKA